MVVDRVQHFSPPVVTNEPPHTTSSTPHTRSYLSDCRVADVEAVVIREVRAEGEGKQTLGFQPRPEAMGWSCVAPRTKTRCIYRKYLVFEHHPRVELGLQLTNYTFPRE